MSPDNTNVPSGFLLADVMPFALPAVHVLDIGALLEGTPVYQPLLKDPATRLSGFEPSDKAREELEKKYKGRGRWFPDVLGDGATHTLYETAYGGCTSLLRPNPQNVDPFFSFSTRDGGPFQVIAEHTVQTRRLDDVPAVSQVDFVKLDIQGSELMVLKNGLETLKSAVVIQTEASFLPLYHDQPLFGEQHAFLRAQGFELHKLIDVTGRAFEPFIPQTPWAPTSQMIEADAIFVRSMMDLAALKVDEILRSARILHDVYRSFDLVSALLHEHDRRAAVQALPSYIKAIKSYGSRLQGKFMNIKGPFES